MHTGVDVVAAGPHLVEAERLQAIGLRAAAGHCVHPDLRVALTLEFPDLMALGRLDDTRGAVGQCVRQPMFERVCRLHDMVVHRDHGVAHLPRLGLRQEEIVDQHKTEYARGIPASAVPRLAPAADGYWGSRKRRRHGRVGHCLDVRCSGARRAGGGPLAEPRRHPARPPRPRRGRRRSLRPRRPPGPAPVVFTPPAPARRSVPRPPSPASLQRGMPGPSPSTTATTSPCSASCPPAAPGVPPSGRPCRIRGACSCPTAPGS